MTSMVTRIMTSKIQTPSTRRRFLKTASMATLSMGVAACSAASAPEPTTTPPPQPTADSHASTTSDPDAMHEAAVKKYLANIGKNPDFWGKKLEPEMDGDTKVFKLVTEEIDWEVNEGNIVPVLAYNRQVPGPVIRVTEGDKVRVIFTNKMKQSHAIH